MSEGGAGQTAQEIYWKQLVILKVVACYVRLYRDRQARWVNRIGLFKAVVMSGTIGAWAIWKDYAFVWGVLIGAAQIVDAAKDYLPKTRHTRSASEFLGIVENAFIDARFEWFSISTGAYNAAEVMDRWRALAKLLSETEGKYFPEGIPVNPKLQKLAEDDASAYIRRMQGLGGSENG